MQLDDLLSISPGTYTQADRALVEKAYYYAEKAHDGQKRASGEPYFTHCVAVAMLLCEMNMQSAVVAAGLLHDTVEDTGVSLDDLRTLFDPEVAKLVDGVTKLTNIPNMRRIDRPLGGDESEEESELSHQAQQQKKQQLKNETLRKTFIAMADDIRVIIIKLSDRLHNMRTLSHTSKEKQRRIAQETLDIYAPIADRLGIWRIKWELEDLAFRYVHPQEYAAVADHLASTHALREREIHGIIERLKDLMETARIDCEVSGRPKHLYSIYGKMLDRNKPIEQLLDLRGVRLIVKDVADCYAALGQIHTHWRPVPNEFDDYIASPKDNFYQSLHTAVTYDDGKPLEVQIRTREMHQNAEYGVAAHWRYKGPDEKKDPIFERRVEWLRSLMDWRSDVDDAEEFVEGLKSDVLQDRVFVFTPHRDIIDLPSGSTPLDFAYTVHTEVGHRCRGAKVNGRLVPLNYVLQNGDEVSVMTAKQGGPSRDWLNPNLGLVHTQRARSKIRAWFKWQDRELNLASGKDSLKRELTRLGLMDTDIESIAKDLDFKNEDELYIAVGCGDCSAMRVINKINERMKAAGNPVFTARAPQRDLNGKDVSVLGVGNVFTTFGRCCNPAPGDAVVGYITKGHGVTIHKSDCPNIKRAKEPERIVSVEWGQLNKTYSVAITIKAYDRQAMINDVTNLLVAENVNLENINVKNTHNYLCISLVIDVKDITQLSRVLTRLEALPNVVEAYRDRPG